MSKETISVLIPTYNRAPYIKTSLDSVLNQRIPSGFDLQVIVVDDGSTDHTDKLMKAYNKNNNILYKRIDHSGKPAVVRNVAFSMAKGSFIAFQDSDDVWAEDKLIKQLSVFEDPAIIGSYGNAGYINKSGGVLKGKQAIGVNKGISGDIFYLLTSRNKPSFPAPSVILRKEIMDKVGPFNENLTIATDTEYWIRYSAMGKFAYIDDILCYVRRHDSNISSRPSESGLQALYKHESNRINMYEQVLANAKLNSDQTTALKARLIELYNYVAELSAKLGDEKARQFEHEYGEAYQKARKRYYGSLPKNVTALGFVSKLKRGVSARFPRAYSRVARLYKKVRNIQ